ncbi:MAG: TIGR01777 family oxidoreductase [Acidimicrobiia bacterium]
MRVLVSGSSGLIGSALVASLREKGHEVVRLVRREVQGADEAWWNPSIGEVDDAAIASADGVVHLAGAPIGKRWTDDHKKRILDSRVSGTRTLAQAIAAATKPPVLVSASGINFYGFDRGDEEVTETSTTGDGYLAEVSRRWEEETAAAAAGGARVVVLRTGIVIARKGGAFGPLLPLFKAGLGGPMGRGRAWWSWISLPDHVRVIERALTDDDLAGPVNSTAPEPARNREIVKAVGSALHRPAVVPVPPFGPAILFGREMAKEVANVNLRVLPAKLLERGHRFEFPTIDSAARALFA